MYFNIPINLNKIFCIFNTKMECVAYLVTLGIQECPLSFKGDDIIENNGY